MTTRQKALYVHPTNRNRLVTGRHGSEEVPTGTITKLIKTGGYLFSVLTLFHAGSPVLSDSSEFRAMPSVFSADKSHTRFFFHQ